MPVQMIFDTDCVLCSRTVHFILGHERGADILFVSAWSAAGLTLATAHGFSRADLDRTFVVIVDGQALSQSGAAIAIASRLRAPWSWLRLLWIVPRPVRDATYRFVARRRYRWWGRRDHCFVPPPDMADRFIDA